MGLLPFDVLHLVFLLSGASRPSLWNSTLPWSEWVGHHLVPRSDYLRSVLLLLMLRVRLLVMSLARGWFWLIGQGLSDRLIVVPHAPDRSMGRPGPTALSPASGDTVPVLRGHTLTAVVRGGIGSGVRKRGRIGRGGRLAGGLGGVGRMLVRREGGAGLIHRGLSTSFTSVLAHLPVLSSISVGPLRIRLGIQGGRRCFLKGPHWRGRCRLSRPSALSAGSLVFHYLWGASLMPIFIKGAG